MLLIEIKKCDIANGNDSILLLMYFSFVFFSHYLVATVAICQNNNSMSRKGEKPLNIIITKIANGENM